ncbi:GAF domain-containing protein [Paenibacillus hemerocallicola]|uniref:GAF domain-containing protein n=1 Tax=Paenibacillus hemerocallicola TaxID=1172614 RepID=A0A5C4T265_9BACL|nr:GAF domain-containing SpoIIE family protein phosphatase [Paenibacillus hemerocallicola]TNJ62367.1 GAF domain-containing protein [Paenibacillus hemerocallicola]
MMSLPFALLAALAIAGWVWSERSRRVLDKELRRTMQLFDVSLEMNSTIRKQDLLQRIMDTSAQIMNAEASSVILVDPETGDLFFELATGEKGEKLREIRLKMGEGIAGWVAENGQPLKIDDASKDPRWSSKVANRVDYATRNLLCVPIFSKGSIIGVLQVLNKRNGKPFTDRDVRLLESIAAPTAVSLENAMLVDALEKSLEALKNTVAAKERMESELRIAQRIQMGFLPMELSHRRAASAIWHEPEEKDATASQAGGSLRLDRGESGATAVFPVEVHAMLRPAREVGGDFYDYFMLGDNELFFALGDVSDKGIPAALYMAMIMTLIKGRMSRGITPGELLTEVNRELYKDDSTMFATIICGVLDVVTGKLEFSDGGHCTPYILRSEGGVEPLVGKKNLPLGVMDDTFYSNHGTLLKSGDRIVLYTDGITEAEDLARRQYGSAMLQSMLDRGRSATGPDMLRLLIEDVDRFANGAMQSDDIAVMTVEKK